MKINISTIIEAIEMADDNFTFFFRVKKPPTWVTGTGRVAMLICS